MRVSFKLILLAVSTMALAAVAVHADPPGRADQRGGFDRGHDQNRGRDNGGWDHGRDRGGWDHGRDRGQGGWDHGRDRGGWDHGRDRGGYYPPRPMPPPPPPQYPRPAPYPAPYPSQPNITCRSYDNGWEEHFGGHATCQECKADHGECTEICQAQSYACTGSGTDYQGRVQQVYSRDNDQWRAEDEAHYQCQSMGLSNCQVNCNAESQEVSRRGC